MHYNTKSLQKQKLFQTIPLWVYISGKTVFHFLCKMIRQTTFVEETKVSMYPMTEEEIAWYVSTKEPMDKAGAYGIQGLCARFVEKIQGDYNNVVGLPVGRIYQKLKKEESF